MKFLKLVILLIITPSAFALDSVDDLVSECFNVKGEPQKCADLAKYYSEGISVDVNYEQSKKFAMMSCDRLVPDGCSTLASLYKEGKGLQKDFKEVKKYYTKAYDLYTALCNENDGYACAKVGDSYLNGAGTAINKEKAQEALIKSCDLNSIFGCALLAKFYTQNINPQNSENSKSESSKNFEKYAKKACLDIVSVNKKYSFSEDIGRSYACNLLGEIKESKNKLVEANSFYEKTCNLGSKVGCYKLALYYLPLIGDIIDEKFVYGLFLKSCSLGDANACLKIVERLKNIFSEREVNISKELSIRACKLNDGKSCDELFTNNSNTIKNNDNNLFLKKALLSEAFTIIDFSKIEQPIKSVIDDSLISRSNVKESQINHSITYIESIISRGIKSLSFDYEREEKNNVVMYTSEDKEIAKLRKDYPRYKNKTIEEIWILDLWDWILNFDKKYPLLKFVIFVLIINLFKNYEREHNDK